MAQLAADLVLTTEQETTFGLLQRIRQEAGEHEDKFTKLSLLKAKQQSEFDSVSGEVNALVSELTAAQNKVASVNMEKLRLTSHMMQTEQELEETARKIAGLQHSILALKENIGAREADLDNYKMEAHARLQQECEYCEDVHQMAAHPHMDPQTTELADEVRHLQEQLVSVQADLKKNREESDAFCKERFVRGDVPPEVTSEASALFDNTQLSLEDLEARVAGR